MRFAARAADFSPGFVGGGSAACFCGSAGFGASAPKAARTPSTAPHMHVPTPARPRAAMNSLRAILSRAIRSSMRSPAGGSADRGETASGHPPRRSDTARSTDGAMFTHSGTRGVAARRTRCGGATSAPRRRLDAACARPRASSEPIALHPQASCPPRAPDGEQPRRAPPSPPGDPLLRAVSPHPTRSLKRTRRRADAGD